MFEKLFILTNKSPEILKILEHFINMHFAKEKSPTCLDWYKDEQTIFLGELLVVERLLKLF